MNSQHYLAVLRHKWWMVVLITALALLLGLSISLFLGPRYRAATLLFVNHASSSSSDVTAARMLTRTYAELVTARPVLEDTIGRLGLQMRPEDLQDLVRVSSPRETQLISIEVTDRDPSLAATIANTIGEAFIAWIATQQNTTTDIVIRNLDDRVAEVVSQIDTITTDIVALQSSDASAEISAQINALEVQLRQQQTSYAELVDVQTRLQYAPQARVIITSLAQPPETPGQPGMLLVMLFAGGIGLALGFTLIGLIARLDGRIEVLGDLRGAQVPALSLVPEASQPSAVELITSPTTSLSMAISGLRNRLHLAGVDQQGKILALMAAHPGQGKPLIAANLAVALAKAGQRVILIDGDIRAPSLHTLFGSTIAYGLSELLNTPAMHPSRALLSTPEPNLQLLAATAQPEGSSAVIMQRTRLHEILTELQTRADIVIIAAPVLDATGEGLLVGSCANYALLVAETGRTRIQDLRRIVAELQAINLAMIGSVLYGSARRPIVVKNQESSETEAIMASGGTS
ncbi:MAG TPA: Wzz/FepE/Etk N-terminal domain-containing protein [Roseiflexaceae bacterium]|nr:Wzz/FepE/Etk N-terminal domain-containing protein [Roseiflexaceae bacterium]HMP39505.1 Wzz/FepE/Etk N-terminal domain-containing protein [Roseiflexaceae bacterium]